MGLAQPRVAHDLAFHLSRGIDTAELAKKLGAHHYIDSSASDPAAALQALGGAKAILCVWFSFVLRLVC